MEYKKICAGPLITIPCFQPTDPRYRQTRSPSAAQNHTFLSRRLGSSCFSLSLRGAIDGMQCGASSSGPCTVVRRVQRARRGAGRASLAMKAASTAPVTKKAPKEGPILIDGQVAHSNTRESMEVLLSMTDYVEENVSGSDVCGRECRRKGRRGVDWGRGDVLGNLRGWKDGSWA